MRTVYVTKGIPHLRESRFIWFSLHLEFISLYFKYLKLVCLIYSSHILKTVERNMLLQRILHHNSFRINF